MKYLSIFFIILAILAMPAYAETNKHSNKAQPTLKLLGPHNNQIFAAPINTQCGFAIGYTHSVALSPVTDYFNIIDGSIYLEKTKYQDFGAGLPTSPTAGQTMMQKDGFIEISGFHQKLPYFSLRVGRVSAHRLILLQPDKKGICHESEVVPLIKIAKPGSSINFEAN